MRRDQNPQDMRIRVEELVYEAERMGLETLLDADGELNEQLIAHHLSCDTQKAARVKLLLQQRYPEVTTCG